MSATMTTTRKAKDWADGTGEELQRDNRSVTVTGKQHGCFLVYRSESGWQCLHIPSSRGTGLWRTRDLAKRVAVELTRLGDWSEQRTPVALLCDGAKVCRTLRRDDDDSQSPRLRKLRRATAPAPAPEPAPIPPATLTVGTRVRHSGYVIMKKRDYWNSCGSEPAKSRAKQWLDDCIAERGTVTAVLHNGLEVRWDSGCVSRCLSYLVIPA